MLRQANGEGASRGGKTGNSLPPRTEMTARVRHARHSRQPPLGSADIEIHHLSLPRPERVHVLERDVQVCMHGLRMKTRWSFAFGSELEMVVANRGHRVRWAGIVVGCQRRLGEAATYDTLVYCPEFPEEAAVRRRAARNGGRAGGARKPR